MNIVVIERFLVDLNHCCCPEAFVDIVEVITEVFRDIVVDAIVDDLTNLEKLQAICNENFTRTQINDQFL